MEGDFSEERYDRISSPMATFSSNGESPANTLRTAYYPGSGSVFEHVSGSTRLEGVRETRRFVDGGQDEHEGAQEWLDLLEGFVGRI